MVKHSLNRLTTERGEADQTEMKAEFSSPRRLAHCLGRVATNACHANQRFGAAALRAIHFLGGERKHGLQQADLLIVNGKLSGMNANGQSVSARREIISTQGALPAFVQPPRR